jgi:subtilisin family serine protease
VFVPVGAHQDGRQDQAAGAAQAGRGRTQDSPRFRRHQGKRVPNHYIVVLDQDATGAAGDPGLAAADADQMILGTLSGRVRHVYAHAIHGFSAEMTEAEAVALSNDPRVRFVEEDSVMEIVTTQANATWGIDRIDKTSRPLNGTYTYTSTGSGVNVYIIDTGIRITHTEFGGRASVAFDAVDDGRNGRDCNGHGTHVSGTVGGSTYGVAKAVHLFSVRVLKCSGSGTTSGVIAGVDWVTAHHISPAVANMSLGGGASTALDTPSATRSQRASPTWLRPATGTSMQRIRRPRASARPSQSGRARSTTSDLRSRTSAASSTSSRQARASRPRGRPATRLSTSSAARRWRRRT